MQSPHASAPGPASKEERPRPAPSALSAERARCREELQRLALRNAQSAQKFARERQLLFDKILELSRRLHELTAPLGEVIELAVRARLPAAVSAALPAAVAAALPAALAALWGPAAPDPPAPPLLFMPHGGGAAPESGTWEPLVVPDAGRAPHSLGPSAARGVYQCHGHAVLVSAVYSVCVGPPSSMKGAGPAGPSGLPGFADFLCLPFPPAPFASQLAVTGVVTPCQRASASDAPGGEGAPAALCVEGGGLALAETGGARLHLAYAPARAAPEGEVFLVVVQAAYRRAAA